MTEMPNGNGVLCNPGEAERALHIVRHHTNTELGATDEMAIDPPGVACGQSSVLKHISNCILRAGMHGVL